MLHSMTKHQTKCHLQTNDASIFICLFRFFVSVSTVFAFLINVDLYFTMYAEIFLYLRIAEVPKYLSRPESLLCLYCVYVQYPLTLWWLYRIVGILTVFLVHVRM